MPRYWMITNRNESVRARTGQAGKGLLGEDIAELTWWVAESGPLNQMTSWQKVRPNDFRNELIRAISDFPLVADLDPHDRQRHVTLYIHGYNNDWADAAGRYEQLCHDLFTNRNLGVCVLFTWPSDGQVSGYLPDRRDARRTADQLAEVLNLLYDYLMAKQRELDPLRRCRAKTSIIAHSMGNYVLQEAMRHAWDRNERPMLVSLVNQLVMIAADVDNDLFRSGEQTDGSAGDAIAQLTYRVTSLFSGRDQTLGLSAGLKHFGKRRLGRSGLDRRYDIPDNVWDIDCSSFFPADTSNVHSAYFTQSAVIDLVEQILRGVDRNELVRSQFAPSINRTA
jgi:esterase/lipase superfamily enzyme